MPIKITKEKLKELLVRPGHISEEQFNSLAKESEQKKISLEDLIVEKGLISDENLGKTIADGLGYRFIDLKKRKIQDRFIKIIPEIVAFSQEAIIFDQTNGILKLATTNPENYEFIKLLEKKTGLQIEIYYTTSLGIKEALKYYKSDLKQQAEALIQDLEAHPQNEENIIKLVNLFLEYAYDNRASDIHIEPLRDKTSVRFRIDGVLHEVLEYPLHLHERVVFRIKIMARLRTDEHKAPQDGKFEYKKDETIFDVRVSILPVTDGENVVLRILGKYSRSFTLENLGLLESDLEKIKRAITKPYGMVLAVGPTGSGKTTTLYAILQILNKPQVNIMTIEDPVEYDIEHVQQTQVNPKKNLTFATGLRSIVRQDPDIIMVGEIRDKETADIAVNAAMTGHLLLSTLHSNDAATTFPRLIDMGIEPFLVASSVNLIIAQRLVRRICEKCRMSYSLTEKELELLQKESYLAELIRNISKKEDISKITFYKGAGCKACGGTGYSGRIGIFEVIEVVEEIRPLIIQKASSDVINEKAKELGMISMIHNGILKVFQGITTLEEIIRVTKS